MPTGIQDGNPRPCPSAGSEVSVSEGEVLLFLQLWRKAHCELPMVQEGLAPRGEQTWVLQVDRCAVVRSFVGHTIRKHLRMGSDSVSPYSLHSSTEWSTFPAWALTAVSASGHTQRQKACSAAFNLQPAALPAPAPSSCCPSHISVLLCLLAPASKVQPVFFDGALDKE